MHAMPGRHRRHAPDEDWALPWNDNRSPLITIGLDATPFVDARNRDIRNTALISMVLLVLGFGGFVSLYWLQRFQTARRSLQDTAAFAGEMVTSLPVGLIATDRDGRIAYYNSAAERITGLELTGTRGRPPETVLPKDFCGFAEILDGGNTLCEQEMECRFDGRGDVPLSVSASRITNQEGEFVGRVLIFRDLGEVRRLQEEIRRKEKLAAIGSLASGVAHEIRNPLSSIKGLASYFGGKFAENSEDREAAAVMVREVDRINRVISELLEFAGPGRLDLKSTRINDVVTHSIRLVRQEAAAQQVTVDEDLAPGAVTAPADADRLAQCLLNLYVNALEAMKGGGRLTVATSLTDRNEARIDVRDTGPGIPADQLQQIFDPYFTTKTQGTGLGLAIVHSIVEAHGGRVSAGNRPEGGAVFTITIPYRRHGTA